MQLQRCARLTADVGGLEHAHVLRQPPRTHQPLELGSQRWACGAAPRIPGRMAAHKQGQGRHGHLPRGEDADIQCTLLGWAASRRGSLA